MTNWIEPGRTIGMIGGGNQAYLTALAAKRLGYRIGSIDPDPNCPIASISDWMIESDLDDEAKLIELAYKSDVVFYEDEQMSTDILVQMMRTVSVPQGDELLSVAQDRMLQKSYLENQSINIAPFATIVTIEDIAEAIEGIGYPCILKRNQQAPFDFDSQVLYGEEDIGKARKLLNKGTCVLEAWIPAERECTLTAVKDSGGTIHFYPVTETFHRDGKLSQTITPARIEEEMEREMQAVIKRVGEGLTFRGVFGVEVFVASTGTIYVNEVLAFPHMAAAYSLHTTNISQYEMQVRALCGWPLPKIELKGQTLLVPFTKKQQGKVLIRLQKNPNWFIQFYPDKENTGAWTGHFAIQTSKVEETLKIIADMDLWKE
ncbi:ATP-grasp domain-containing protein [Lacticigenium naphthae]|uniref:ATP-grasp domain-containing protein n=1 Tax=Lacticigenium naphthae TaxID=515351 RepID=UPI00040523A8|nr:ATP-grasp domain-containing protein [Lacticigenium naphthae]